MQAFEENDLQKPPPANPIIFAGSSTMTFWFGLARDFAEFPVVNRGFGGSEVVDSTHFADRILLPLGPRQIVLYAGENDLARGKPPEQVFADYQDFVHTMQDASPGMVVSFTAIKPSPGRRELFADFRETNRLIEEWSRERQSLDYIDTFNAMLNSEGEPRTELWTSDGVHINRAGYKLWASVIRPYLRNA